MPNNKRHQKELKKIRNKRKTDKNHFKSMQMAFAMCAPRSSCGRPSPAAACSSCRRNSPLRPVPVAAVLHQLRPVPVAAALHKLWPVGRDGSGCSSVLQSVLRHNSRTLCSDEVAGAEFPSHTATYNPSTMVSARHTTGGDRDGKTTVISFSKLRSLGGGTVSAGAHHGQGRLSRGRPRRLCVVGSFRAG